MFLLFILLAALTFLILKNMINGKYSNNNNNPPGPWGLPFIGNLHQFDKSKPHIYLWQLSKKYGPLAYLKHGPTPILVVSSSKMAEEILKTQDLSFCSRPPVMGQQKLAYDGLDLAFSPYNNHWKEMRKISVLHLLSPKQVLTFRPIREDEVSRMIHHISSLASSGRPADLSQIAMSLASNFICRVAFGRRYDDDEYEKMRYDRLIMEAQALMVSFYYSDHFPKLGYWMDKMMSGRLMGRLEKNCKELDVFYQQLIDEHLHPSRPKLPDDRRDIIDLMIQLMEDQQKGGSTSISFDLTWDHIKALLMELFVAGTDTVAAAIVWTMTALMMRPSIMKRAQHEIRQLLIDRSKGSAVDEDDIKNLPYLKAVVMEALRLYPPAPLLYRKQIIQGPCMVEGYRIQPGTSVIINGWAIARDPEIWDNPNEFWPERFLIGSTSEINLDRVINKSREFNMIPFGGGRRGCPGMGMGLISTELALANLLYAFDWDFPSSNGIIKLGSDYENNINDLIDTDALPGLTMHKKSALVLVPTSTKFINMQAS